MCFVNSNIVNYLTDVTQKKQKLKCTSFLQRQESVLKDAKTAPKVKF